MKLTRRATLKLMAAAPVVSCFSAVSASADSLVGIAKELQQAIDAGYAPGLVGLIAHDEDVHVTVLGHMALDGRPMQRDSIFRIASMTKPITAAAVMMLVEDGKLKLDEPVDRLLPELANRRVLRSLEGPVDDTVPANRPITVEDLLSFRCGWGIILKPPGTYPVQKSIADLNIVGFGPPDPLTQFDGDEWLKRLGTLPLFAQPGERFMYTTASNILGVLIARVERQPFGQVLAERIFNPLGMKDTGFIVPESKLKRLVTAYRPTTTRIGGLEVWDPPVTGGWSRTPKFEQGDGGLVSTADDYLAFARMLLSGGRVGRRQLLSTDSIEAMTTNRLTPAQREGGSEILGEGNGWGYGMSVAVARTPNGSPPGSIGWTGGFGSKWESDPKLKLTTILLTQRMWEGPKPVSIFEAFERGARRFAY